ncbi:MAG: NAD-dependent epimerase/dehydratase family protein [Bacteroidales bacterium]|nr:NAD-dependent epimerase/dehydratase family protein [Bacteroidales bacterium]
MVLLLGATGLLGRNVLEVLLERKIPVRVLVRSSLDIDSVEVVHGDILNHEDLWNAARGCSAIINCAGTTDMSIPTPDGFYPVNRDLPWRLCRLSSELGISVLIHTSTANTMVCGTREHPSDENAPFGPPYDRSPYAISKKAGEDILLEYAGKHPELRVVIVNPGFMLGAWDKKPSSGQLILLGWRKPILFVTHGAKSFLHVRDAATAIVNALSKGSGRYLLTGPCIRLKDFYKFQAKVCGYRQWCIQLPDWMARLLGKEGDFLLQLGIRSDLYEHNVRQLLFSEWYTSKKAQQELDYPATPVEDAIRDFTDWWFNSRRQ